MAWPSTLGTGPLTGIQRSGLDFRQVSWNSNTLATWCEELTHLKCPWCGKDWRWEEKGMTGLDGWMASPTQRAWVWVNSGSWWWTGRPSVLQSMGSQRVGHNWVTELTELNWAGKISCAPQTFLLPQTVLGWGLWLWLHILTQVFYKAESEAHILER